MKILVVGDCHGVSPDLDDMGEEADLILATGDICGDSDEMRNAMFSAMDTEKRWYDVLGREKAAEAVKASIDEGEEVLEYLNSFGKPVFIVPGNWDWIGEEESWSFLQKNRLQEIIEKHSNIHNINGEVFQDSNYSYIGYGPCSAPEVPQYEDEKPEDDQELREIKQDYMERKKELAEKFRNSERPVIFLSHNVPHKTSLDRIENPDSPSDGKHYGSLIVRDMLENFEPVLSVAGHIHEGKGTETVKDVLCLNAGLHSHAMVEIEESEVKNIEIY